MTDQEFAELERRASKPAEELLDGFMLALGDVDTAVLEDIAAYREVIHPGGWMQKCVREYLDVWR